MEYGHDMDSRRPWERVYRTKAADQVSWYRPHLDISLSLITSTVPDRAARIIDVGGGEATLVDDLLAAGYTNLEVLDLSETALAVARDRLGDAQHSVTWLQGDVTTYPFEANRYAVWHDRAVFHFLTSTDDRRAYVEQVVRAMRPGGIVIVATFGPEGPLKCSGLDVIRYDADQLHGQFGDRFELIDHRSELHATPFGTTQQFVYCMCRL